MYNHNKAQQSKNRVHISWDMLYKRINAYNILLSSRVFTPNSTYIYSYVISDT